MNVCLGRNIFLVQERNCCFEIIIIVGQGLEGYSRDPGFDQNTVRDSGKRKIS